MNSSVEFGYRPFHRQCVGHAAPETHVFMAGGWGSGKTRWNIGEAVRNTVMSPGVPGLIISPTFQLLRRTLFRTIVEMFPGATRWPSGRDSARHVLGPMVRSWSAQDMVLTMWDGTEWFFASADQPGSLEGVNVGWMVGDEARLWKHEAWLIANARVRHPGSALHRRSISGVPAMGWLWEEFGRGRPGRKVIHASSLDNPYLPKDYVHSLGLSDRMSEAYVHGRFVVLEGVVYWTYDPRAADLGGSILEVKVSPDRVSYGALDPGGRSPWFGLSQDVEVVDEGKGVRVAKGGELGSRTVDVYVDELVGSDTLTAVHARECAELCRRQGVMLTDVYIDPGGLARNDQTGMQAIQVYRAAFERAGVLAGGMRWTRSPVEVHIPNGIETLRARLQDAQGVRRTFLGPKLVDPDYLARLPPGKVGLHGAFLGYQYPKNRPGNDIPKKDGVHDHPCDGARYLTIGRYGVLQAPERRDVAQAALTHDFGGGIEDAF